MKRFLAPILLMVFLFPSLALGVEFGDLVQREGLYYEKFTDVPFSGKIDEGLWRGLFKNGKSEGLWVRYSVGGQLSYKGTYKDGEWDGPWVGYWNNGQLQMKGTYKDGEQNGPWVAYHKDGTVNDALTGTFKDGVKVE
jgi:antitoxin component YwqK of YwqJK toxin-antitoxin module